jgi:conjugal transfer mating pair stabilization protein TraN
MQTGYSDCCTKTDSWFGLTKCGTTEVALGHSRTAGNSGDGYCHSIGDYCAEEWNLGLTKICVQKKDTYCCFNGLLARIIQEQGRPQLAIEWGTPRSPNCRGFTPEEFQKLDFSKINLGEFTDQVVSNASNLINKNMGPAVDAELQRFNKSVQ